MEVERVQVFGSVGEENKHVDTNSNDMFPEIPVVDLADPDCPRIIRLIAEAAEEWGIFQVVNHGIPREILKEVQMVGKEFFELPLEEKEAIAAVPGSGSFEGYASQMHKDMEEKYSQGKKTCVDFLMHNIWPPARVNYNFWPKKPSSYGKVYGEYAKHLQGVVDEMLKSLSIGLGLGGHVLKDALGGEDLEFLSKSNYYPTCPRPDLLVGLVEHTDMASITILITNEVPGLQVFKNDKWIDVKYIPNALVVNIGDQIEVLSNGKYRSVLHRAAVNKEIIRMSLAIFCAPPGDVVVGPLAELVNNENPPRYKTKKFKDYEYCKINKIPQ